MSSHIGLNAWSTEEEDATRDCGHCDNCTRDPASFEQRDVTLASWQILQITDAISRENGRVTLTQLVTMACGGKGDFTVPSARGKNGTSSLDVEKVAGGRVQLSKDVRIVVRVLCCVY